MKEDDAIININQLLQKNLQEYYPWEKISNDSNTQYNESKYKKVIIDIIQKMGGHIGSFASSQRSKDIRDVIFPSVTRPITYECKKSGKTHFMLNDTVPSENDNYYYIFINAKKKKVSIKHCSYLVKKEYKSDNIFDEQIIKLTDCVSKLKNGYDIENIKNLYNMTINIMENAVNNNLISFYDYGQLFKRTVSFPNGLNSRPRPNWTFTNKEI